MTIASWAAIFSAASASGAAGSVPNAVLLIAGVGVGSLTWDLALASGTALAGRAAGERLLRVVDLVAGVGLICFGAILAFSVLSN
jgi:threonine/homoserine/homoserine lactone efflux protein